MKALVFDCFEVLVISPYTQIYHDFPELYRDIRDLNVRSDYGFISHDEYNKLAAEITGISEQEVVDRYWKGARRNEELLSWIRKYRANGRKVALLSNVGRDWLNDYIPESERHELFDVVVLSSEVGLIKPARAIYEYTSQQLGVPTADCVMIDDNLKNIQGAEHAGMTGIVYTTLPQFYADIARIR